MLIRPTPPARSGRFVQLDQPDLGRPVLFAKIFRFTSDPNHLHIPRHPGPHKGAFRDRHGRRVGMRWTRVALLTRALTLRTAKSCGPDVPTLASSSREASFLGMTVTTKPGHRGEREISF